ncbi:MAG: hypothetical protein GXP42_06640 [Chloroflexi bacterium]|nr:hypothetical protein [Chloroflexota bacterium]
MSDKPSPKDAAALLFELRRHREVTHQRVQGKGLSPEMAMLRAWQSQRLARTHADLLASKRYGPACRFFLEDIYAPKDFSQRDYDIIRIHDFMMRFLPARVLHTLTKAIELQSLTEELDQKLLDVLLNHVGVRDHITEEQYAEAYRLCDNYDERVYQIELVTQIGRGIERLVRLPLIGWTLRAARRPAVRGGWEELQGFLERGYAAFKHMGKADYFLNTIEKREKILLDNIYQNVKKPFRIND